MSSFQDQIVIKGTKYHTESQPLKEFEKDILETYFDLYFIEIGKERHYFTVLEIRDLKLYLTDLKIYASGNYESVFKSSQKSVFANWFSGEIVVEKERSYLSNFMKEHDFKKKHYYTFKEGIQASFYPIDYITEKDKDKEAF